MNRLENAPHPAEISALLRGDARRLRESVLDYGFARVLLYVVVVVGGTATFGAAVGMWRAPLQAFYAAAKLPLILLLTGVGNGVLNGLLAPLLGTNIGLRQSMMAVLMSFAIAAAVLGAFSPLVAFAIWNAPPLLSEVASSRVTHSGILLTLVAVVAFAGVAGNLRLLQLLRQLSPSEASARRTLVGWLAGNLLLGSQISWILRPFVGSPGIPVEFVRPDPWRGSFFESVLAALQRAFS